MIKAALTGGIASGKSEIIRAANSFPGVETVQADDIAKEIYEPENPCFPEVIDLFGRDILTDEGEVDLGEVSDLVFSDPDLLEELEKISHPYVTGRLAGIVDCLEAKNKDLVLVEIPLLFQSSSVELDTFDVIILVRVDRDDQLKRLVERDGISREKAKKRIEFQRLPKGAEKRSDYVINAEGTPEETRKKARNLIERLLLLE